LAACTTLGDTVLHAAAAEGYIDQIPAELITAEALARKNQSGLTPVDVAKLKNHLNQIPPHLRPSESAPVKSYTHHGFPGTSSTPPI
jgi:hypothetical protein